MNAVVNKMWGYFVPAVFVDGKQQTIICLCELYVHTKMVAKRFTIMGSYSAKTLFIGEGASGRLCHFRYADLAEIFCLR